MKRIKEAPAVRRAQWMVRQLLPLTYRTRNSSVATGDEWFVVWRMWFGRCFAIDRVPVRPES